MRVFGSVAEGTDREGSDLDLLFSKGEGLGLLRLARMEREISETLGVDVDLIPDSSLRPGIRERVLRQALPL